MSNFDTSTMTTNTTIPYHNITHKRRAKTPSFSSILLDTIYRSIDDSDPSSTLPDHNPVATTTTTTTTRGDHDNIQASKHRRTKMRSDSTLETVELRHAIMIESWIEKQPPQQQPQQQQHYYYDYYRDNNADYHNNNNKTMRQRSVPSRSRATLDNNNNNNSSSYNFASSSSSSSSCFTNLAPRSTDNCLRFDNGPKRESSRIFTKTKSKALKIYSDLKKSKQQQQQQPVSPGARIAAFLNSIFRNAANLPPKRSPENPAAKMTMPAITSVSTPSTCSTASSYARSCLSKNTTSTEKSKRSVRFYPVSVIVDEDSKPCGHKSLGIRNELHNVYDHNGAVVDDQKLLLSSTASAPSDHQQQPKNWKREKEIDALMMMIRRNCTKQASNNHGYKEILSFDSDSDDEMMINVDDDEDGESCASSDLFELENLSSIGVSRFNQELPVYGTTSLKNLTTSC